MVGWHYQVNRRKSVQTLGDNEGQGSLACCSPWGHKESDMSKGLNNNKYILLNLIYLSTISARNLLDR